MASKIFSPRKRRTRQHVIADLSVHYVEGLILEEGHTAQRLGRDYGYDLFLFTFDEPGYVEPGLVRLQLKASETLPTVGGNYFFDLDVRDYNLWMLEEMPVILILFDASRRRAYWCHVQPYFREDAARRPNRGAKSVRVPVQASQAVNRRAIRKMRDLKRAALRKPEGEGT